MKFKSGWMKYISLFFTVIIIGISILLFKDCDINTILNFTPENPFMAGVIMLGIFALKSLSVIFPASAVFMASGVLYSFGTALTLNISGVIICFTISYLLGRFAGEDIIEKLINKYSKVRSIFDKCSKNSLFTAYVFRATGIPTEVGSMIMGASGLPYRQFIVGSLLGMIPKIILYTAIGNSVDGTVSKGIIVLIAVVAVIMFFISFFINKYMRKNVS